MKQKNLILIAVAVGFGLLAALLATQMNAKQQGPPPEVEVELPVAAKEIPINTQIPKADFAAFVTWKKFRKDAMPPGDYATTEVELADKRVVRTFREGELFAKADLSDRPLVEIPPGYDMMTFGINPEKIVGGFAGPGSKVDVLATVRMTKSNKMITFPLFRNLLILAVDVKTKGDGQATPNVSNVSVAVTKEQARRLHAGIERGANLRLLLLGQGKKTSEGDENEYKDKYTDEEIWQILNDEYGDKKAEEPKTDKPAFEFVRLPVPKENLPAGTQLTKELLDSKFTTVGIEPPAPDNVVKDIREHTGKFLLKDVTANKFVARSDLADSFAPMKEPAVVKPEVKPAVEVAGPPPEYWDVTVQTPNGVKKFRYLKKEDGKYLYLGEIKVENDHPAPEKKKADPDKADDGKTVDRLTPAARG